MPDEDSRPPEWSARDRVVKEQFDPSSNTRPQTRGVRLRVTPLAWATLITAVNAVAATRPE
jgi:hypothetical protein